MPDRESRARDRPRDAEGARRAADEGRLAGTEIAAQRYHVTRRKRCRELRAQCLRLTRGPCLLPSHRERWVAPQARERRARSPMPAPSSATPANVSGSRLRPVFGKLPEVVDFGAESRDGAVGVSCEDVGPAANAWPGTAALTAQVTMRAADRTVFTGCDTVDHCRNQVLAGELLPFLDGFFLPPGTC